MSIDVIKMIRGFQYYLAKMDLKVSRAEFEQNLLQKKDLINFRQDIEPLLPTNIIHDFNNDFVMVMESIITLFPGSSWQGIKENRAI